MTKLLVAPMDGNSTDHAGSFPGGSTDPVSLLMAEPEQLATHNTGVRKRLGTEPETPLAKRARVSEPTTVT